MTITGRAASARHGSRSRSPERRRTPFRTVCGSCRSPRSATRLSSFPRSPTRSAPTAISRGTSATASACSSSTTSSRSWTRPRARGARRRCPRLRLLVTSREALRIAVEREYPLSPLPESPSVELFRQRASAVAPEQEVEYATASAICDRLDRLPLAIELAAARCKALSPEQILDRLSESLDLLRGGRDADPRQQTLRATIEWSYDLLSDEEQRLFRALSVFRGGCTLEAAEAVCDANLDTLQSLVEKSLLRFTRERYWMLETIREFARERLSKAMENDRLARRHARHYLTRLEEIDPVIRGPRTGEFLTWYAAEEDNLRATLERLAAISPDEAARVAYLLSLYWVARGALDEGRDRLQELLAFPSLDGLSRASLLTTPLRHRGGLGHLDAAQSAGEEAVTLATTANAQAVLVDALWGLAWIADRREEFDDAIRLGSCALEEATSLDDTDGSGAMDLGSFLRSAGRDAGAGHFPRVCRGLSAARRCHQRSHCALEPWKHRSHRR